MTTVGILVNPRAGTDVRRLATGAPRRSEAAVLADLRRVVDGAYEAGAHRLLVSGLPMERVSDALHGSLAPAEVLESPADQVGSATTQGAALLRDEGAAVIVVSGGDGTHRDVACGWRDAPIVARASGTNNSFPQELDASIAGLAAGLAATDERPIDEYVAYQALTIDIEVEGRFRDLALGSVAVMRGDRGTGSVWQVEAIDQVFAAVAEPWSIGLSALAGVVAPTSRADDQGVLLDLDPESPRRVTAPTAPGHFADAGLRSVSIVEIEQPVAVRGPARFVVDGERGIGLDADEWASMTLRRNGPRVIDIRRTFAMAVRQGRFYNDPAEP